MNNPEVIYSGKWIEVVKEGHWEYVRRTKSVQAACITALTKNQELVLIEEYRVPVKSKIIELPAGLVGDEIAGEDPAVAASRELMEETGFVSTDVVRACGGPTSAGLSNEMLTYILAFGAEKKGEGGGLEGEDITTRVVPLSEVESWLYEQEQSGVIVSPRIYVGLYWLNRILMERGRGV